MSADFEKSSSSALRCFSHHSDILLVCLVPRKLRASESRKLTYLHLKIFSASSVDIYEGII